MADNYLEKKMDDYRRGLQKPRRVATSSLSGYWKLKVPQLRIVIAGQVGRVEKAIISLLASHGCKVAFTDPDIDKGTVLAQQTGALFLPLSDNPTDWSLTYDFAVERWGGIDIVVFASDSSAGTISDSRLVGTKVILLSDKDLTDPLSKGYVRVAYKPAEGVEPAVARLVLFLSLPENACLYGQTISVGS